MSWGNFIIDAMFFVRYMWCICSLEAYQQCSCERVSRALAKELVCQFKDGVHGLEL